MQSLLPAVRSEDLAAANKLLNAIMGKTQNK